MGVNIATSNQYVLDLMTNGYSSPVPIISRGLIYDIVIDADEGGGPIVVPYEVAAGDYTTVKKEIDNALVDLDDIKKVTIRIDRRKLAKRQDIEIIANYIKTDIQAALMARYGTKKIVEIKVINDASKESGRKDIQD